MYTALLAKFREIYTTSCLECQGHFQQDTAAQHASKDILKLGCNVHLNPRPVLQDIGSLPHTATCTLHY